MTSPAPTAAPSPLRGRRAVARVPRPRSTLTRGSGIALGASVLWLSILVLIPLGAVVAAAASGGWAGFWAVLTNPQTVAAITLTVTQAALVTLLNIVIGTAIAWVLVRDSFPGKRAIEVIIDVPFALPTIVAGLVLLGLYGPRSPVGVDVANTKAAVFLAFAFVTLPFVVRAVQPVLEQARPGCGARRAQPRCIGHPDLDPGAAARARSRHRRGSGDVLRPSRLGVRRARAHLRQPGAAHRGHQRAHPYVRRERPGSLKPPSWRPSCS
ncbi:hypothetical protein GCM10025876_31000 [Demequina litorisediminis]|uniref:ABC transmembrane type-1 domain-containing protein n=1 Tax=Demequina litorisediminis TaxID=1849022 RepID=A0ABQ6IGN2_9MICO|nr:molybdate ABC transporter permease subunit [Demequina litorisediminis]GMA36896.1 hypothetical protein GCM10025876_31000 [Demequina litorisediminis]